MSHDAERPFLRPSTTSDRRLLATLAKLTHIDANIDPQIMGGSLQYNAYQLAELAGTTPDLVENLVRWLGRAGVDPNEVLYTDADVQALRETVAFIKDYDIDLDTLGSMVRTISAGLERLALRQVESTIQTIANQKDVSDTRARIMAGEALPQQADRIKPLVGHLWRRQYAEAVRRLTTTAIAQRGLSDDDNDYPLPRAVGFADLVGFTARMRDVSAREFSTLISDFTDQSWDIITGRGGRIVSFIGDAVFFTADDVRTGAEVALGLAEKGETGICGPVRVGMVWTRVLVSHGDMFGPGVNLASRITAAADPNEVFIGPASAARLAKDPRYSIVAQPPFDARGIGVVQPYLLRYANDARNDAAHDAAQANSYIDPRITTDAE